MRKEWINRLPLCLCLLLCGGMLLAAGLTFENPSPVRQDPEMRREMAEDPALLAYRVKNGEVRICVNTALPSELQAVPGVGEVLANRIYFTRLREGDYRTWDDLLQVEGLGEETLRKIRPYLTLQEEKGE